MNLYIYQLDQHTVGVIATSQTVADITVAQYQLHHITLSEADRTIDPIVILEVVCDNVIAATNIDLREVSPTKAN